VTAVSGAPVPAPPAEPAPTATARPEPAAHGHRPELDGVRTIAVYLVLLFHTGLSWAEGGFIGVDLFFVLSGLLVSGVLLDELDRSGSLRVGRFYARRVRRLLPAALVTVLATCLTFTVLWSVVRRLDIVDDARSALLYYANWHFVAESGDYFASGVDRSPFLHFWSLAIEEQFYVVFPLLLLLLWRRGSRALLVGLTAVLVVSLAAQLWWATADTDHAYYGTDARVYQLFAGAALTVALRTWPRLRLGAARAHAAAVVGLVGLLVLGSGLVDVSPSVRGIGATVVAVLLLGGLVAGQGQPLSRLLGSRVPAYLGRISYGTYLWHWPVIVALTTLLDASPVVVAVFAFALGTGLAALSYEVVEMPLRRSRLLDRVQWPVVVGGVAVSALVAVTLVPGMLEQDRRPALSDEAFGTPASAGTRTAGAQPVPAGTDWRAARQSIGEQHWCAADDGAACVVHRGDGPHVLLVGDSQAVTLVPMFRRLAKEHDLTLSVDVVAGCPWQEGLDNDKLGADYAQEGESARVGWYDDALRTLDPDVVVLLDRPRDDPEEWGASVSRRDGRRQPLARAVYDTTRDTLREISAVADHTLVVQRLVMPETFDPTDCLATRPTVGDCAVTAPSSTSPSDGYVAAVAARDDSVTPVDLNPAFCPGLPVCEPMVGDRVVYRDDHHYTATWALHRRAAVWRLLTATGALGDG
jgi:peptidoglycan/LPS O-acetylase OafA/YrhL